MCAIELEMLAPCVGTWVKQQFYVACFRIKCPKITALEAITIQASKTTVVPYPRLKALFEGMLTFSATYPLIGIIDEIKNITFNYTNNSSERFEQQQNAGIASLIGALANTIVSNKQVQSLLQEKGYEAFVSVLLNTVGTMATQ